jgi:hypothetical protein
MRGGFVEGLGLIDFKKLNVLFLVIQSGAGRTQHRALVCFSQK